MARLMIGPEGQVALPAALLAALEVEAGDFLIATAVEDGLLLTPEPHDLIEATYGLARALWAGVGGSAGFVRETEESWRA